MTEYDDSYGAQMMKSVQVRNKLMSEPAPTDSVASVNPGTENHAANL